MLKYNYRGIRIERTITDQSVCDACKKPLWDLYLWNSRCLCSDCLFGANVQKVMYQLSVEARILKMIASWPKIVSSWDPEESPALCAYLDQFIDLMNKWSVSYTAIVLKYRRMLGSQEPKTFYAKRPKFVV